MLQCVVCLCAVSSFLTHSRFDSGTMTHEHTHRGTQVSDMLALRTNANGTSAGLTTDNAQVVQTVDEVGAVVLSTMHCVLLSLSSLTREHVQSNAKVAVIYRASDDGSGDVIVVINMYNSKVMYSNTRAVYTLCVHTCTLTPLSLWFLPRHSVAPSLCRTSHATAPGTLRSTAMTRSTRHSTVAVARGRA